MGDHLILSKSDYQREVGLRLRRLIDACGMKYVKAAELMGVPKNQLGNWMRGNHGFPDHYALYRFCRIAGVNTDWVYLGDPSGLPQRVTEALLRQEPELARHAAAETQAA